MQCEACHGQGKRLNPALAVFANHHETRVHNPERLPLLVFCDECGGSGVGHCCDGLQEQPAPAEVKSPKVKRRRLTRPNRRALL